MSTPNLQAESDKLKELESSKSTLTTECEELRVSSSKIGATLESTQRELSQKSEELNQKQAQLDKLQQDIS